MSNENKNIKAKSFNFGLSEPLAGDKKKQIYKMVITAMASFRKVDLMYQDRIPDSVPNAKVKRALAMASSFSSFVVDYMEKNGLCVNLDSETMQGMLTPLMIVAPAIACSAIEEISADKDFMNELNND